MGSEAEESEQSSAPKLALFSLPPMRSSEQYAAMGMATPPHHTASVPFRWEEEPGKPRPCKALSLPTTTTTTTPCKELELPPRLLYESKFPKTPSPTTVLEGPYVGRSIFHSLRFIRTREVPFDGGESGGSSPERGLLGPMVHSKRGLLQKKERARVGSWRKTGFSLNKGKKEVVDEGSFVFSSFSDGVGDDGGCGGEGNGDGGDTKVEVTRITRKRSLLGLTKARSNFWATIYGAVKQVIPCPRRGTAASKQKN